MTFPLDAIKATIQATPYEEQLSWIKTAQKMQQKCIIYYLQKSIAYSYIYLIHNILMNNTTITIDGWRAFIRGLLPCALRAVPACSAMFATVDITRGVLLHNLNSSSSS